MNTIELPHLSTLCPAAREGARLASEHLRAQAAAMVRTAKFGHRGTLSPEDRRQLTLQAEALRAAASAIRHQMKPPGLR